MVRKFLKDIYGIFCGDDGKISYRKLAASIILYLICRLSLSVENGVSVPEWLVTILVVLFLMLLGIVAGQSLMTRFLEKDTKKTKVTSETIINET